MPGIGKSLVKFFISDWVLRTICSLSKFLSTVSIKSTILSISFSFIPLVVIAGVPILTPEGSHGFLESFGIAFLFRVILALV